MNYAVRLMIMTQRDLGYDFLTDVESNKVRSFDNICDAVNAAREHAEIPDKFIKDWIYEIVPMKGQNYEEPIEIYVSVPTFKKSA